jgi:PAS domain S-box-containing protein
LHKNHLRPQRIKNIIHFCMKIFHQRLVQWGVLWASFYPAAPALWAEADQPRILTTVAEVRNLSVAEAEHHFPVKLRGVVTFFDNALYSHFIQDETAGIYLFETNLPALSPGQLVEVKGFTSPGEYAPIIVPETVVILGQSPLPAAQPVTFEQLASGKEDSQFVEITGVVRAVHFEETSKHFLIELATGGGRLTVYAHELPILQAQDLVDSIVRLRGVCSSQFNRQRQLFAIRLLVPNAEDVTVETPAMTDPFAIQALPAQRISSLFQFTPQGTYGHRVKIIGTVSYFQPGNALYVRDGNNGLFVQTKDTVPLQLGDRVEVLGFAAPGQYTPALQDASYRKIAAGLPPTPAWINRDEALKGDYDCRLICIEAKLLSHARDGREESLTLESGGFIFRAYQLIENAEAYAKLENGSRLAVTGICLVEPGDWLAGETWRAKSFRVLLRSPADVVVLRLPPWWTLQKLLWTAGGLAVVTLGASTWIVVLRRRVQQQTLTIRQQLQIEATLKERYVNLFESANDVVFTHDLNGRITSVNTTGEQLLQRRREEILALNLMDLLPEDQHTIARQWLDQVLNHSEPPTVELDFLNAVGQRFRLEISTRIIGSAGEKSEVESIGRDVTERKRLEKEILEVSNREQRRIGHDLHDGVCQQLAATTYLMDILAEQLQEKGCPEFAEAERIGKLITQSITYTRGIARGLFPVKLEESGVASALEEIAENTSSLFKIDCRFYCDSPLPELENSIALHLYYITQESVLNAAKHGKATCVNIALTHAKGLLTLTVEDDGIGLQSPAVGSLTGMGIRIMRYRARVIGGTLSLQNRPNHGTQVRCQVHFSDKVQEVKND